jgi:SAM-dependent methyltransferase
MDCTRLGFPERSFDEVVTIATTHHLDDAQLARMVGEALRVCRPGGHLHIIDAILPVSPNFLFKRVWFRLDRGAFPRTTDDLVAGVEQAGRVIRRNMLTGPLHDTIYLRVAPSSGVCDGFSATPTTCSPAPARPGSRSVQSSRRVAKRVSARIPGRKRNRRLKTSTSLFMKRQKPRNP